MEAMRGDKEAQCMPWFEAYAQSLPAPLDAELRTVATALFRKHKRVTLGSLFKVPQVEVEHTIRGVLPNDPDGVVGWRAALEDSAGFCFASANVPPSAALAKIILPSVDCTKVTKASARIVKGESTISDDLLAVGVISDTPVDEACFSVFSGDYAHSTVSNPELGRFLDAILKQFGTRCLKINLGAPLLEKISIQCHRRVPHLPIWGKVPGEERNFKTMLYDKTVNRKHVSPTATPPPSPFTLHHARPSLLAVFIHRRGTCTT
jgi:hypothetical protein